MKKSALALLPPMFLSLGLFVQSEQVPPDAPPEITPTLLARHTPAGPATPIVSDTLSPESLNAVIGRYCTRCHGDRRQEAGMSLLAFDVGAAEENGELAEKMVRKLVAGMMPPAGARRPGPDTLLALRTTIENRMDSVAAANPNPGGRTFQRLNREEYARSIRQLFDLEVDVSSFLPLDTKSANFDNIADVQMPSETLMEGYLRAAGYIARIAVGDPHADASSSTYKVPRTASQKDRVAGAPIGTRGGVSVIHNFPADGKYVFQVTPHPSPEGELFGRNALNEQIEIALDGERVAVLNIDRWMSESDPGGMMMVTDSIDIRAGARRVTAAFVKRFEGLEDDLITPIDHTLADTQIGLSYGVTTLPHLQRLSVVGPFEVTGVSDTPTRRAIFTCRPTAPSEERTCAESILGRLATQAYRRPVNAGDLEGLMTFYDQGSVEDGFEGGIRTGLQAMLASPHFVFRMEEPAARVAGNVYTISDVDLASRLSFFLWGSPPDSRLLTLAERGELSRPEVLNAEVRRMLDETDGEALASRFAAQWLRLQDLEKVHPDALTFPYFDATLADAMHRETELLFAHIVTADRSVLDLLTADYTFVNERLARHYGLDGVNGSAFRRVTYPDDRRRGILGHGSVLTMTSHADRTSPVLRGKWVMEVMLGTPPPPPPPDVPDLEATAAAEGGRLLTTRERMEQHRRNPACRSCHRMMDPIGLALDNFDVTGRWRIKEHGMPLDTQGELYDGSPVTSPSDLRNALLRRPEAFIRTFTENLMAYALGRRVEYYDMPTIRAITRNAAEQDYRMSAFIAGIVNSPAFRMSRSDAVATDTIEGQ